MEKGLIEPDESDPARGVINGLKYSLVIWAIIIGVVWAIYHW